MGVMLRIADTLGRRLNNNNNSYSCYSRNHHGLAGTGDRKYVFRKEDRSMLWSILRHPAAWVMIDLFFYQVTLQGEQKATEELILKHISQHDRFKTFCTDYLRLKRFKRSEQNIEHLLQNYDFLAVSEHMGESLVVLSTILKLPLADVIVLPSKQSGGYEWWWIRIWMRQDKEKVDNARD